MDFLKNRNKFTIGKQPVTIGKITIAQWEQLFDVVESLPALIIEIINAPQEDKVSYLILSVKRSFDEITTIVSILTGIDRDYIKNNAGLDEVLEYFTRMAEVNNFTDIAKNIKSVLALSMKEMTNKTDKTGNA